PLTVTNNCLECPVSFNRFWSLHIKFAAVALTRPQAIEAGSSRTNGLSLKAGRKNNLSRDLFFGGIVDCDQHSRRLSILCADLIRLYSYQWSSVSRDQQTGHFLNLRKSDLDLVRVSFKRNLFRNGVDSSHFIADGWDVIDSLDFFRASQLYANFQVLEDPVSRLHHLVMACLDHCQGIINRFQSYHEQLIRGSTGAWFLL